MTNPCSIGFKLVWNFCLGLGALRRKSRAPRVCSGARVALPEWTEDAPERGETAETSGPPGMSLAY